MKLNHNQKDSFNETSRMVFLMGEAPTGEQVSKNEKAPKPLNKDQEAAMEAQIAATDSAGLTAVDRAFTALENVSDKKAGQSGLTKMEAARFNMLIAGQQADKINENAKKSPSELVNEILGNVGGLDVAQATFLSGEESWEKQNEEFAKFFNIPEEMTVAVVEELQAAFGMPKDQIDGKIGSKTAGTISRYVTGSKQGDAYTDNVIYEQMATLHGAVDASNKKSGS
ncbi:MAG: hypothetical protein OEY44_04395 [Candidatus Peregrinibacteria bacterium]|nr:hypothetical protein [Candidatus Peregrinibacteria bacterium]